MSLQRNEGGIEQIIRVVLGLALLAISILTLGGTVWLWVGSIVGVVMLITGISGFCPLYSVIGLITKKDVCPTCSPEEAASMKK